MNRLVVILPFFFLLFLSACGRQERGLSFVEAEVKAGLLDRTRPTDTIVFSYRNVSDRPVMICNVLSTDLSVEPLWSRSPLLPGKSGELKAVVRPGKWSGHFGVRLMVYTGEGGEPYRLKFEGEVEKKQEDLFKYDMGNGMKMSDYCVRFGQVFVGETATDTLWVYNASPAKRYCRFRYNTGNLRVKSEKEELQPGDSGWIALVFAPADRDKYGNFNEIVQWHNDADKYGRINCISVSARVVEDFLHMTDGERRNAPELKLETSEYDFGVVEEGIVVTRKFRIANDGRRDLILRNIETSCGCTVADVGRRVIPPGEYGELTVSFNTAGREGQQQKSILVTCNDYRSSTFALSVRAEVKAKQK